MEGESPAVRRNYREVGVATATGIHRLFNLLVVLCIEPRYFVSSQASGHKCLHFTPTISVQTARDAEAGAQHFLLATSSMPARNTQGDFFTANIERKDLIDGPGTHREYSIPPRLGAGPWLSRISSLDNIAKHCPKVSVDASWTRPPSHAQVLPNLDWKDAAIPSQAANSPNESRTTSSILISEDENELLIFPHSPRTSSCPPFARRYGVSSLLIQRFLAKKTARARCTQPRDNAS